MEQCGCLCSNSNSSNNKQGHKHPEERGSTIRPQHVQQQRQQRKSAVPTNRSQRHTTQRHRAVLARQRPRHSSACGPCWAHQLVRDSHKEKELGGPAARRSLAMRDWQQRSKHARGQQPTRKTEAEGKTIQARPCPPALHICAQCVDTWRPNLEGPTCSTCTCTKKGDLHERTRTQDTYVYSEFELERTNKRQHANCSRDLQASRDCIAILLSTSLLQGFF